MNPRKNLFVLPILCVSANLAAQISTTVVHPTLAPRSVVIAGPDHVICSLVQDGRQQAVDVFNPATPFVDGLIFDAPYSDQFCDAIYTPAFGGRMVTAHRYGGINLLDASIPDALSVVESQAQPPKYSHEGLDSFTDGSGDTFVAYSEHNVSNTGGGLRFYKMTTTALVPLGSDILVGRDGNGLEIAPAGDLVYQTGFGNADVNEQHLYVWDTAAWTTPTLIADVLLPGATSYYDKDIERAASENLLIACGFGGLWAADVTVPSAPLPNLVFQSNDVFFDGLTFFPGTNLAMVWGYYKIGVNYFDFMLFVDASIPGTAVPVLVAPASMKIADVKLELPTDHWGYMVGTDRGTGETLLQIW